jgi:hypothetical protein
MPGDVELCIGMGFLMFCDRKFEAPLSNIAPGANLYCQTCPLWRGLRCLRRYRSLFVSTFEQSKDDSVSSMGI